MKDGATPIWWYGALPALSALGPVPRAVRPGDLFGFVPSVIPSIAAHALQILHWSEEPMQDSGEMR